MSPKQKLTTLIWCAVTMVCTLLLSHGHLIVRELLANWPTSDSWEGRLETALYTQGGLALLASVGLSIAMFLRSSFLQKVEQDNLRRRSAMRERHERAAAKRHDDLMTVLSNLAPGEEAKLAAKKSLGSGQRPR